MKIKKPAVAGTLESSDCMVTVEPADKDSGIDFELESAVIHQFGESIKRTVLETLERLDVEDAARYSLFHALKEIDYRGVERVVRINGLDTPHWQEDVRVCMASGAEGSGPSS